MKQVCLLLFLLLYVLDSYSQNVGIGTPAPSAKLTVSSTSSLSVPTLELRDQNLSGTPRLKLSNAGGDFGWYMTGVVDNTLNGMENSLLNISFNNDALPLFVVRGNGNVGIGQFIPQYKLDIFGDVNMIGALRMNGNAGTAGQVLMSNGNSTPSWQTLPAAPAPIGFSARLNGDVVLPNNTETMLTTFQEFFDDGNGFNPATGTFTAPVTGLYHFDVTLNFAAVTFSTFYFSTRYSINNLVQGASQLQSVITGNGGNFGTGVCHSFNIKLTAGNTVRLHVIQASNSTMSLFGAIGGNNSCFSGYKVY